MSVPGQNFWSLSETFQTEVWNVVKEAREQEELLNIFLLLLSQGRLRWALWWRAPGVGWRNEEVGMCYVMPPACVLTSKHY